MRSSYCKNKCEFLDFQLTAYCMKYNTYLRFGRRNKEGKRKAKRSDKCLEIEKRCNDAR